MAGYNQGAFIGGLNALYADGQGAGAITPADHRTGFSTYVANSVVFHDDLAPRAVTGTDTYAVTVTYFNADAKNTLLLCKFANANTGAATLQFNGTGSNYAIKKNTSEALVAGDIAAGEVLLLAYDGTNIQIVGRREPRTVSIQDLITSRDLTTAEILTGNSVPIEIVSAPGSGFALIPYQALFSFSRVTASFATNTSCIIRVGTNNHLTFAISPIASAVSCTTLETQYGGSQYADSAYDNQNINFFIDTGDPTGGGTSSGHVIVKYYKITL